MAMEEKILSSYDTFEEFPDGILVVKENTNAMYIQKGRENFVAREFLKYASGDEKESEFVIDYKDVITGKTVLTSHIIRTDESTKINYVNEKDRIYDIIPLDKIFSVKGINTYSLSIADICTLINYKSEEPNVKRKSYF